jgi:hypothetical protein
VEKNIFSHLITLLVQTALTGLPARFYKLTVAGTPALPFKFGVKIIVLPAL